MSADDDGFVTPRKVIRMVGVSEDDIKILITKGFVIPFESGVIVITHWKMNNTIKNDRYSPSIYKQERQLLSCNQNVYRVEPIRIQDGTKSDPQEESKEGRKRESSFEKNEHELNAEQIAQRFEQGRIALQMKKRVGV